MILRGIDGALGDEADRRQSTLFPECLDDSLTTATVRLIHVPVNSLDSAEMNFDDFLL
jgi:hypothetical protein